MSTEYPMIPLGKIASFRNGINYNKSHFGAGMQVLGVSNFGNRLIAPKSNLDEINPEGLIKDSDFLDEGDIIFVRSNGNRLLIGRSMIIEGFTEPVTHSAFTIRTHFTSSDIVPRFYAYVFKTALIRSTLTLYGGGTNINNLNQQILTNLSVPFPPMDVQKRIANILSVYDDLIENNTRRIQILEEMAQRIYREWFVHFRYPGHENDKLVDSGTELGMIPKGWKPQALGDSISFSRGRNITKKQIIAGNVPVIAAGIKPAYYHNTSNVCSPVITISSSGANAGHLGLHQEDIWASDCSYLSKGMTVFVHYYYSLLLSRKTEIRGLQRGSAQPHVYGKDVEHLFIPTPPDDLIKKYEHFSESLFTQVGVLNLQIKNLQTTRDMLLPKLISGQIDVSESDIDTGDLS